jgi:hypothetical protein
MADSGDKICRPGGGIQRGKRGGLERRSRAFYRHGAGKKRQVLNQELKRRIYRGETVAGVEFGPGKKMTDGWGPLSVREGVGLGYRFGFSSWAAGWFPIWAESVPEVQFQIFISLSSFPFLFSKIRFVSKSFAN